MRFSELEGARVGVWGAGREIRSFAAQCRRRLPGARIATAVFDGPPPERLQELLLTGEEPAVGGPAEAVALLGACDVVVRSPGVSIHRPEVAALRDRGTPVTTATALWLDERGGGRVMGVTGTKGKSTTAALAHHLLVAAGELALLAGNIGVPAIDLLDADDAAADGGGRDGAATAVVELSSYQIADLGGGPRVAVFTNLYSEHLDWHGSPERYRSEKLRLASLPGVERVVYNARDESLVELADVPGAVGFGAAPGWDATTAGITRGGELVLEAGTLPLRGAHNALNLCAALAALEAYGASAGVSPDTLAGFAALPHRLQTVLDRDGVAWVDDSISTTPESALAALASYPDSDVLLIAGGQDRGQDHAALAQALAARGATLVAIGTTGPELAAAARAAGVPASHALDAEDLGHAVALARERARPGSVVLLSPAAPSFDGFRDFEDRGDQFAALARADTIDA